MVKFVLSIHVYDFIANTRFNVSFFSLYLNNPLKFS